MANGVYQLHVKNLHKSEKKQEQHVSALGHAKKFPCHLAD
jgi:hypothetical protein